ncbi:MAG: DUF3037 domain-containing protein [Trueperaceae bacterium]
MNKMDAFYSVLRYIPNMLRGEFVNVGVVLVCPKMQFQGIRTIPSFGPESKVRVLGEGDGRFVRHAVTSLSKALQHRTIDRFLSSKKVVTDGLLTYAGLNQLRLTYHNNIQLTEPRPVLVVDPESTLENLYQCFVGAAKREAAGTVTRKVMRKKVKDAFRKAGVLDRPEFFVETIPPVPAAPKVDFAYRNDVMHYYQVVPFEGSNSTRHTVQSYRMTARDMRDASNLDDMYRSAEFTVLGHYPEHRLSGETEELVQVLNSEGIRTLDYLEAGSLARKIAKQLNVHDHLFGTN